MALLVLKPWSIQDQPFQVGFREEGIVRLVGTQRKKKRIPRASPVKQGFHPAGAADQLGRERVECLMSFF